MSLTIRVERADKYTQPRFVRAFVGENVYTCPVSWFLDKGYIMVENKNFVLGPTVKTADMADPSNELLVLYIIRKQDEKFVQLMGSYDEYLVKTDGGVEYIVIHGQRYKLVQNDTRVRQYYGTYAKPPGLVNTERKVNVHRVGPRVIWKDPEGQEWVKCFVKWWRYPEEIDY